jgi:hypothetical protein
MNKTLPNFIRKTPLKRAHWPSMLCSDPIEAVHSELIIESVSRYFEIFERHDTGGGIAYDILTHNDKVKSVPVVTLDTYINKILTMDKYDTESKKVPVLFTYFLSSPRKDVLK